MTDSEISGRARVLLKTLVERHIRDGQPVGSKTLMEEAGLPVSAATIRNVLCDLEERGFLHSPHTSAGRVPTAQGYRLFVDSYVLMKDGEAFLLGSRIMPLDTASTHFVTDPIRTRKLLLHKKELAKILAAVSQKGLTCVCTQLYWKGHLVKARIALAKGKQDHDKRDTQKDRDWNRQKQRVVRDNVKQ